MARRPVAAAIFAAASSPGPLARAVSATSAPASASAVAIVRPRPRAPPVTSATFPSRRNESRTGVWAIENIALPRLVSAAETVAGVGNSERAVRLSGHLNPGRRARVGLSGAAAAAATSTTLPSAWRCTRGWCACRRCGSGGRCCRLRRDNRWRWRCARGGTAAGAAPAAAGGAVAPGAAGAAPPGPPAGGPPRPPPGGAVSTAAITAGSSTLAMKSPAGLYSIPALYAQCACHRSSKPGDE